MTARPADRWGKTTFGRLARIGNGADYSSVEVEEGGYPVYGSGGEFRRASNYLFDGESVLFGRKGTVDRPLYVEGKFWTVDTMFYSVIDRSRLVPRFAYYWATTLPFKAWATDTALPSMSSTAIKAAPIALPSVPEQRAIADYLDRETAQIDEFIAKNEELITLLTERRAAAVETVVMGLSATANDHSSELWRRLPIRAVATESRERNDGLGLESYLSLVAGRGVMPYAEKGDIGNKAPAEFDNCKVVRAGDVVINSMNYGIGSYGLSRFDGICSPVYVIVRPNTEIRGQLLEALLGVRAVRERVQSMGNGILAHRSAIGWAELKNFTIPVPPRAEQDRVVEGIKSLDDRFADHVVLARSSISLARERRAALISAAVTGKIDVGVAV